MLCFCKSGRLYSDCCEILISGLNQAENCEQLMRSRYSAFAVGDAAYLLATSSTQLLATLTEQDLIETSNSFQFVHLEILNSAEQSIAHTNHPSNNSVEFIAHLLSGNEHHKIHEKSQFIFEDNRLKYDTGLLFDTPIIKLNRNDHCPCQSGKKFKKCHMK